MTNMNDLNDFALEYYLRGEGGEDAQREAQQALYERGARDAGERLEDSQIAYECLAADYEAALEELTDLKLLLAELWTWREPALVDGEYSVALDADTCKRITTAIGYDAD